jgi:hypothetical protein
MNIELSDEQMTELGRLVEQAVGDLSSEIAGTDNAGYRRDLLRRREVLQEIANTISSANRS